MGGSVAAHPIIREAVWAIDIDRVVEIHLAAFPGFFLTALGGDFLRGYYRTLRDHHHSILLLAEPSLGAPADGFVAGVADPARFQRDLRKHAMRLGLAAVPTLCRRPGLVPRVLRSAGGKPSQTLGPSSVELTSMGVLPSMRRTGRGTQLVEAFVATAATWPDSSCVVLTTDADDNEGANRFYAGLGFGCIETFQQGERSMNLLRRDLGDVAVAG